MIRSDLVKALAKDHPRLREAEVQRIVDVFFDEIAQRLADGGKIQFRGFGTFSTRERDPRSGRNPRTGEGVSVAARRVLHFKPGLAVRNRLMNGLVDQERVEAGSVAE